MPRRFLPLLAGLMLLVPALARAEGVNLSWTNCANGPGASDNFQFNCDDENQVAALIGSFIAPAGIDSFLALEGSLTVTTDGRSLPDFWQIGDSGCRNSAASPQFTTIGLSGCTNPWGSQVVGIWNFTTMSSPGCPAGLCQPGRPWIRVDAARITALQLSSGREYFAFQLNISMQGMNGCQGCRDGACLILNSVKLWQPAEMYHDAVISTTAFRNYVTWNGGGSDCPGAKANRKVTWGEIKNHYRDR